MSGVKEIPPCASGCRGMVLSAQFSRWEATNLSSLPLSVLQVTKERGEQLAIEYGIKFMETSAKASIHVEEAFFTLARDIKTKMEKKLVSCFFFFRHLHMAGYEEDKLSLVILIGSLMLLYSKSEKLLMNLTELMRLHFVSLFAYRAFSV